MVKNTEKARKQYGRLKMFTRRIQPFVLITYILIMPLIESPDWCNDA